MTTETFKLIDAVQREGMDSGLWGVIKNVNTRDYFGTDESKELTGHHLYVYHKKDENYCFISQKPDYRLAVSENEDIEIYKID